MRYKGEINVGKVGMDRDTHPSNLGQETYSFAMNANIADGDGEGGLPMVQNEPSNVKCLNFPDGYRLVGFKTDLLNNRTILFLTNPNTGFSEIGSVDTTKITVDDTDFETDDCECDQSTLVGTPLEKQLYSPICSYVPILSDKCQSCAGANKFSKCLNFSLENPIREENIQLKDEKCGQTMYWTDGINPPRYLKLDQLGSYQYEDGEPSCGKPYKDVCTGVDVDNPCLTCVGDGEMIPCLDCDRLRLFPLYNQPCLIPETIQNGGRLKAGVYEFLVAYCDKIGNETSQYFSITNPITVFDETNKTLGKEYTWDRTSLGIHVNVEGLSRKFNYYKVAVIQRTAQDGVTSYYIEGVHSIDDTTIQYLTEEDKLPTTLDKLLVVKPNYLTSEMLTANNGYLFHGGVTVEKEMNLQPVMNLYGAFLKWQTVETTEEVYRDGINTSKYKGYLRDEVYPFSIRFITSDGFVTSNYILPNRPKSATDATKVNTSNKDVSSVLNNSTNCSIEDRNEKWQFYNTATADSGQQGGGTGCEPSSYKTGTFGYYESIESYPDNKDLFDSTKLKIKPTDISDSSIRAEFSSHFVNGSSGGFYNLNQNANLVCKPIRHYRFPDFDIAPFMQTDVNMDFAPTKVYPIGVKLDIGLLNDLLDVAVNNGLITSDQRNRIDKVEVFRGDRSLQKSIIAKGLLYDMYSYKEEESQGDDVLYANYPYNDLREDKLHYSTKDRSNFIQHPYGGTKNGRFTFHSPDTSFRKPTLPTELKIEAVQRGASRGVFANVEDHAKFVLLTKTAYLVATNLALLETLFEIMTKYGDFLVQESIAGDRVVTGGLWGTDLTFNAGLTFNTTTASAPPVTVIVTSGTGSIKDKPLAKESVVVPQKDLLGAGVGASNDDHKIKNTKGTNYKHLDENKNKISKTMRVLIISSIIGKTIPEIGKRRHDWINNFLNNGTPVNYGKYYTSEGWYNSAASWKVEGQSLRGLTAKRYIDSGRHRITENGVNSVKINHFSRESSVYLSTVDGKVGANHSNLIEYGNRLSGTSKDESRFILSEVDKKFNEDTEYPIISKEFSSPISSMYASLKNYSPAQYGRIDSIKWIPTGFCGNLREFDKDTVFGGDTLITRFSLKRKLPMFLTTAVGLADRTPIDYYTYRNIGYTRFYVNHLISDIVNVFKVIDTNGFWKILTTVLKAVIMPFLGGSAFLPNLKSEFELDNYKDKNLSDELYVKSPNSFYLYYYGIPQFLVESDINCHTRYGGVEPHDQYFPNTMDIVEWTQEKNVPIHYDNTYYYNNVFSKNTTMLATRILPSTFSQELFDCLYDSPNGVAYSMQDNSEQDLTDPWLIYKPLDFYQFKTDYGKLIDLRSIESTQILARFENQVVLFNAVDVLRDRLTPQTAELGTGGVFATRPVEFTKTDIGYAGTQHKSMVSNEFGHFWVDAKRGNVFRVNTNGQDLQELSVGIQFWLKEHLPFKIMKGGVKNLTSRDLDNQFKGLGIALGWDSLYKRLFLTKRDYIVNKAYKNKIKFEDGKFLLVEQGGDTEIQLHDTKYFTDASFTIAYSLFTQTWISYYSFKPDYYINHHNYFQTGINSGRDFSKLGIWSHLVHNNSFQVFYGERFPFTLEVPMSSKYGDRMLATVNYWLDSKRYHFDYDIAENRQVGFNKMWVYNMSQNTGELRLVTARKNDLQQRVQYPKIVQDGMEVLATQENKRWSVNTLFNKVKNELSNTPVWKYDINQIDKTINPTAIDYKQRWQDRMRGDWFLIRFSQDKESRYKMIFKFVNTVEEQR